MMELTARSSPGRSLLLILGSIAFVLGGLWMAGLFGEPPASRRWSPEMVRLIGWVAIIFFGACAILWTRRAFDGDPQLEISGAGIKWKPWSGDTIPWREIGDVSVWRHRGQRAIVLHLVNRERFPSRTLLGRLAGANRALTGGDISILMTGLDASFDQAFAAIRQYWPPR